MIPDASVVLWWSVALGLAVVVVAVVAVLLELIVRTARSIHDVVAQIWTGGKVIAGNTVTIALLGRTNHLAEMVLRSAASIARASRRIRRATERTP